MSTWYVSEWRIFVAWQLRKREGRQKAWLIVNTGSDAKFACLQSYRVRLICIAPRLSVSII